MISICNESSFGVFRFLSGGVVKMLVGWGGGEWGVEGGIMMGGGGEVGVGGGKRGMGIGWG
ncbi:TIGR00366 family protein, partial [Bacillus mycoides]|uniref:TIGR00366 family protein n=1 Tax=Bacillus mycoides TaxID=1405 RepID=UPI003CC802AE